MASVERILVAVDGSPLSEKTVRYVARMVGPRPECQVLLLTVLPPLPLELVEHGGAEDPERERALATEMEAARQRWVAQEREEAEPVLRRMRGILNHAGVAQDDITCEVHASEAVESVAHGILAVAREHRCGTLVVGRGALPWYRALFHRHVCQELMRHAGEMALWVVQ